MSKFIKHLSFFLIFLFIGCGDNKVDTSSDKALKQSIEDIRKSLPNDKIKEFNEALTIVMFKDFEIKNVFLKPDLSLDMELSKAKTNLEGKTANEIIIESKIIKENRIIKRKENLKEKITVLEEKKQKSKEFEHNLKSKIKISNVNFNFKKDKFLQGNINFDLSNNMDFTISGITFELKFISPNRDVPWTEITLFESIPGGLMKEENRNINTAITIYHTVIGNKLAELPTDAVPVISITSIYNSSNKKISNPDSFSDWDESNLDKLKKEYDSI